MKSNSQNPQLSTSLRLMTLTTALLALAPLASSETLALDPSASRIRWVGKKVVGQQHDGTVAISGGQVEFDGNQLKGGEVSIDMKSIKNDDLTDAAYNAKLTGHLKSDDFFGVEKHPTAKFKIKSVKPVKNAADATHEISGDLTIKGITHPARFNAKIEVKDPEPNKTKSANIAKSASARGKLTIDRTKYNIRYGSGKFFEDLGDKMISDDFDLEINLQTKR
ncbi:MAG TPA: YceI family protein [Pseudobdellovibrionaceae bacterium]|nr:YceI family protein [Pseudobdellovibrionaceae bacterium]